MKHRLNERRVKTFQSLSESTQKAILGYKEDLPFLEELKVGVIGKNRSVELGLNAFNKFVTERSNNLTKPFYLPYRVIRNTRMLMDTNTFNTQQNKLHRNMVDIEGHETTVHFKNSRELKQFKASFDIILKGGFNSLITNRGRILNDDVKVAVEMLLSDNKEFTKEQEESMAKAIDHLGEGMMGYTMLDTLAAFYDAKQNKKDSFTISNYVEVDGKTNGPVTVSQQITSRFSNRVKTTLRAGKFLFQGDAHSTPDEYFDEHYDNYEQLIDVSADAIANGMDLAASIRGHNALQALNNLVMKPFTDEEGNVTSDGRKYAKPFVMTFVYSKGADSMHADVVEDYQQRIYDFIEENKDNRKELKRLQDALNSFAPPGHEINFGDYLRKQNLHTFSFRNHGPVLLAIGADLNTAVSEPLVGALENIYENQVVNRKIINKALVQSYRIGARIFEFELAKAEKAKFAKQNDGKVGRTTLTGKEVNALIAKLLEEGKLPTVKHSLSEGYEDSLMVNEFEDVRVNTHTGSASYKDKVRFSGTKKINRQVLTGPINNLRVQNVQTNNNTIGYYRKTLSSDIGVKGFLNMILSMDASLIVRANLNDKVGNFANVHDALILGLNDWLDSGQEVNKEYAHLNMEYAIPANVASTLGRMLKLDTMYAREDGYTAAYRPAREDEVSIYEQVQTLVTDNAETKRAIFEEATQIDQFDTGSLKPYRVTKKDSKKLLGKMTEDASAITEFLEEVTNEAARAYRSRGRGQRGAQADVLDLGKFNNVKSVVVNAVTLESTFMKLGKMDSKRNNPITAKHKQYLTEFVSNELHGLFGLVDKINLKLAASKKVMGEFKDNTIYMTKNAKVMATRMGMSMQEVFAHEATHALFDNGFKLFPTKEAELAKIMEAVKRSGITFDDFIPSHIENATEAEIEHAKELYNYIFGNRDKAEFAAFGLTNEALVEYLEKVKIPRISKVYGKNLTPFQIIRNMFSDLVSKLAGDVTAHSKLINLAKDVTSTKKYSDAIAKNEFNPFNDANNNKVTQALSNTVYKPLAKFIRNNPELYKGGYNKVVGIVLSPARFALSTASFTLNMVAHPKLVTTFQNLFDSFDENSSKFVTSLVQEIHGATDRSRPFHRIIGQVKAGVEAVGVRIASGTTRDIKDRFHSQNKPDNRTLQHLTSVIVETDFGSLLGNYTTTDMSRMLSDEKFLNDRIEEVKNRLLNNPYSGYLHLNMADNLADYMVTGNIRVSGLPMNARAIADVTIPGVLAPTNTEEAKNKLIKDIDIYTTLKAISLTDKVERKTVSDLFTAEEDINQENNGIIYMAELHNIAQSRLIERKSHGSEYVKGSYKETYDYEFAHVMISRHDGNEQYETNLAYYKSKGYTIARKTGKHDVTLLVNRNNYLQRWQSGAISLKNKNDQGLLEVNMNKVKMEKRLYRQMNNVNYKLPDYTDTPSIRINPYRESYVLTKKEKIELLGLNRDASEIIGNTMADSTIRDKAFEFNMEVADLILDDYTKHKDDPALSSRFVMLNSQHDNKYRNEYLLIPEDVRNYLTSRMSDINGNTDAGGNIFINKDYIDLVLGYRKASVSNLVPDMRVGKTSAKAIVFHAEDIWQGIVKRGKRNIVILTPAVLIANVVSNVILSMQRGVPLMYALKKQKEAYTLLKRYQQVTSNIDKLSRRIAVAKRQGKPYKHLETQRNKFREEHKRNPVHPLIKEGLFSSIVEDVEDTNSPFIDAINRASVAYSGKAVADTVGDKLTKALPPIVTNGYKQLVIAPDTGLARDLTEATQVSDFLARYALYSYRTQQGKVEHNKAIEEINDVFVNYDWNTSAGMQWINDMGILMYTKFLFRIQKVIYQNFRDRPVNAITSELMQRAIVDLPDPTDSFLASSLSLSRFGSPAKVIDDGFQLNLLHYLFPF